MPVCTGFTLVYAETCEICTPLCKPCPLSSSQTTQKKFLPRTISAVKTEPV